MIIQVGPPIQCDLEELFILRVGFAGSGSKLVMRVIRSYCSVDTTTAFWPFFPQTSIGSYWTAFWSCQSAFERRDGESLHVYDIVKHIRSIAAAVHDRNCRALPRQDSRGGCRYVDHARRIGPGYSATTESAVRSVTPSTVAWATSRRSNGSLWMGGRLSIATTCSLRIGNSL